MRTRGRTEIAVLHCFSACKLVIYPLHNNYIYIRCLTDSWGTRWSEPVLPCGKKASIVVTLKLHSESESIGDFHEKYKFPGL